MSCYTTEMTDDIRSNVEQNLVLVREGLLQKIESVFKEKAIESHVFGSVARGDADAYSDIDIWFTFADDEFEEVMKRRFEQYNDIGEILHVCEPPQNAPLGGVHSALLIRGNPDAILMVDIYLCPLSTSFITKDGKKLFGADLPLRTIEGYNLQKVTLDEDYKINFLICFVFGTLKKLARNQPLPLDAVLSQYEKLRNGSSIPLNLLTAESQNFVTLEKIIFNLQEVANEKQRNTLIAIYNFGKKLKI